MTNRTPQETRFIWAMVVIVVIVIAVAGYWYFSGDLGSTPQ